jgi:hypothetical protein
MLLIELAMSSLERRQGGNGQIEPTLEALRSIIAENKDIVGSDPRSERRQEIQRFFQHTNWQSDQAAQMIRKYPWLAHLLARKEKAAIKPELALFKRTEKLDKDAINNRKEIPAKIETQSLGQRHRAYGGLKSLKPHYRHPHGLSPQVDREEVSPPVEDAPSDTAHAPSNRSNRHLCFAP